MSGRVYLGVDLGAESGRVVAGTFDGRRVRLEELHRFSNGPVDLAGSWPWDVSRLWSEIQPGLSAAARFGDSVASVGVDTWGVDYVLLSKLGELVGQPFHYRDCRTDGVMERAVLSVPRADIFAATGIQFLPFNTLYQLLASPELLTPAHRLLLMPDFFHWLLCGSTAVEFTNDTTTQFFNPSTRTWALELLRRFGLPTHMLAEVVQPGTTLGTLRDGVQRGTGLGATPVVAPATPTLRPRSPRFRRYIPGRRTGRTFRQARGRWSAWNFPQRTCRLRHSLEISRTRAGSMAPTGS